MKTGLHYFLKWVDEKTTFFQDKDVTIDQVVDAYLEKQKTAINSPENVLLQTKKYFEQMDEQPLKDYEYYREDIVLAAMKTYRDQNRTVQIIPE